MQSRVVYGNGSNVPRLARSLRFLGLQAVHFTTRRTILGGHGYRSASTARSASLHTVRWAPLSTEDIVIPDVSKAQKDQQWPSFSSDHMPCTSTYHVQETSAPEAAPHDHPLKKSADSEDWLWETDDADPSDGAQIPEHNRREGEISQPPSTKSSLKPSPSVGWLDRDSATKSLSTRKITSSRPSPNRIIALWKAGSLNSLPQNQVEAWSRTESSTGIFLRYLMFLDSAEISTLPSATPEELERLLRPSANFFSESTTTSLQRLGCTAKDIRRWAWIILAPNGEAAAQRYLSSSSASPPITILNEILRGKYMHIRTLRSLIVDGVNRLSTLSASSCNEERGILQDNSFMVMSCGLLKHARQTDPSSLPSIARMVAQYCDIISNTSGEARLDRKLYSRLSGICTTAICRLSLPAAKTPFESMAYAWEAQQIILEAGNSFQPGLELDSASYRAIAIVLLGNKKTWSETESVAHLHRSWPPWKNVLDGMDAKILPEDEITRVTRVLHNMKAAGYPPTSFENALGILGGRDTDGTPTIPTRSIVRNTKPGVYDQDIRESRADDQREWAARIRATRDVQEAWEAFQAYEQEPSQAMYYEMFTKLVFEKARIMRGRVHTPTPGDGKEVFPVENDNLSETEIQRKRPPNVKGLYARMRSQGLTLGHRCLHVLIEHADTLAWARLLMLDSGMDEGAVKQIIQGKNWFGAQNLKLVPEATMTAYLKMLCRFSSYARLQPEKHQRRTHGSEYLVDALHLLRSHPEWNRAGWHAVTKALAAPKSGLHRDRHTGVRSRYYDHSVAPHWWSVLQAALLHLYRGGREIDPDLFQSACYGLSAALFARAKGHPMPDADVAAGLDLTRNLFAQLVDRPVGRAARAAADGQPPRLLHPVRGTHIHAYVRLLAAAAEPPHAFEALLSWVVTHQAALDHGAEMAGNGACALRRALVALRVFGEQAAEADGEAADIARLRGLMEEIDAEWGGWPADEEVDEYAQHAHRYEEGFMEAEWLYGGRVGYVKV